MTDKIENDQKVWVRHALSGVWMPRHSTGRIDWLGRIECYSDGLTSHTGAGVFSHWVKYSLTDPYKK